MKTFIKTSILFMLLIAGFKNVSAQDKMILRYKTDTLLIKVLEIGTDEIKYKLWPVVETMPVIVEKKDKIRRIIFENGTVMKFEADGFSDPTQYAHQRKAVAKIDPFSLLHNMTSISYEQSIKPGRSWEVGVGIIGLGRSIDNASYAGIMLRGGYKFINQPDFYLKGMRYTHILKGAYVRPEIVFSTYNATNDFPGYGIYSPAYIEKYNVTAFAFMLNFGKQYIFDDVFSVDIFGGLGIGGGSNTTLQTTRTASSGMSEQLRRTSEFGFFTETGGEFSFAIQGGLKIGILLGKKNP